MGMAFLIGAVVIAIAAVVARKLLPADIEEADHTQVDASELDDLPEPLPV